MNVSVSCQAPRALRALEAPVVLAVEIGEDAVFVGEHRHLTAASCRRRGVLGRAAARQSLGLLQPVVPRDTAFEAEFAFDRVDLSGRQPATCAQVVMPMALSALSSTGPTPLISLRSSTRRLGLEQLAGLRPCRHRPCRRRFGAVASSRMAALGSPSPCGAIGRRRSPSARTEAFGAPLGSFSAGRLPRNLRLPGVDGAAGGLAGAARRRRRRPVAGTAGRCARRWAFRAASSAPPSARRYWRLICGPGVTDLPLPAREGLDDFPRSARPSGPRTCRCRS